MINIRTDLASEAYEQLSKPETGGMEGVTTEKSDQGDIKITRIEITTDGAATALSKPKGKYITIEIPKLINGGSEVFEQAVMAVANEVKSLLKPENGETVLVAGLGNRQMTPDSIGPRAIENLLVTRHLMNRMPEYFSEGFRSVCAIAPGVMGTTGVETGEIIRGVCQRVTPDAVVVIDALASRSLERLCTTIQLCDTGIVPGSGVGNNRSQISKEELGVRVVAAGVPTIVDAATVASDVMEIMGNAQTSEDIREKLKPYDINVMVTPKSIDNLSDDISKILGYGLSRALHYDMEISDINSYLS